MIRIVKLTFSPQHRQDFIDLVAQLPEDEQNEFKKPTLEKYDYESSAYFSTARLWDDGIIDPKDTRRVLALGIAASLNQAWGPARQGVFRM